MTVEIIAGALATLIIGLLTYVINQLGKVRDLLSTQNGRVGKLEAWRDAGQVAEAQKDNARMEFVERIRGDLAKLEGRMEAHDKRDDSEFKTLRDRVHDIPNSINADMLKIQARLSRIEERLSMKGEM